MLLLLLTILADVIITGNLGPGTPGAGWAAAAAQPPVNPDPEVPPGDPTSQIWLTYGDSKTLNLYYQQKLIDAMAAFTPAYTIALGPTFPGGYGAGIVARGGVTVADMAGSITTDLAWNTVGAPDKILVNLGVNDAASALPAEATWEANYFSILDAMHVKWPLAKIYLMRPWGQGRDARCDTIATYIETIVTARSVFVFLGPDERIFLKGSDNGASETIDGVHPSTAGGTATADAWKTALGY